MGKRRTIGKDPLSEGTAGDIYSAEIVPIPIQGNVSATRATEPIDPLPEPELVGSKPIVIADAKARRAVGGRLEILGGDLGSGNRVIWPLGPENSIGFFAPTGRAIDLARELDMVQAWPDRTEHRYLSAVGWAWVLASLGGVVGLLAGGGLRLLEPRRMIVKMQLSDGCKMVARTDGVTVAGLKAFAAGRGVMA